MKKLTKTIACAAATAATTALVATTVAIETATAAIFTYTSADGDEIRIDGGEKNFAETTDSDWSGVSVNGEALTTGEDREGDLVWSNENFRVEKEQDGEVFFYKGIWVQDGADGRWWLVWEAEDVRSATPEASSDVVVVVSTPEPSSAIALGVLGLGAVASRLRRRSK